MFEMTNKMIQLEQDMTEMERDKERALIRAREAKDLQLESEHEHKLLAEDYVQLKSKYIALSEAHQHQVNRYFLGHLIFFWVIHNFLGHSYFSRSFIFFWAIHIFLGYSYFSRLFIFFWVIDIFLGHSYFSRSMGHILMEQLHDFSGSFILVCVKLTLYSKVSLIFFWVVHIFLGANVRLFKLRSMDSE